MRKNRNRRLRLNRETIRTLDASQLRRVAGGRTGSTCENSCDPAPNHFDSRPISICESCHNTCQTCEPTLCNP